MMTLSLNQKNEQLFLDGAYYPKMEVNTRWDDSLFQMPAKPARKSDLTRDPISVQTWRQSNQQLGISEGSFGEETVYWQPPLSGQRGGAAGFFFTGGSSRRFRPNYS